MLTVFRSMGWGAATAATTPTARVNRNGGRDLLGRSTINVKGIFCPKCGRGYIAMGFL